MAIAPVLKTGAAKVAYRFESCALREILATVNAGKYTSPLMERGRFVPLSASLPRPVAPRARGMAVS